MSFVRTCFVYVLCVTTCCQFRNQFNNNKPLNICYCLRAPLFQLQNPGTLKISSTPRLCNPQQCNKNFCEQVGFVSLDVICVLFPSFVLLFRTCTLVMFKHFSIFFSRRITQSGACSLANMF